MLLGEFRKRRVGVVALCSYGRSGTSFFMQVLRAAGVTVLGEFPFEERAAQVSLLHWLHEGLAEPGHGEPGVAESGVGEPRFGRASFRRASFMAQAFAEVRSLADLRTAEASLADLVVAAAPRPGARWLGEKFLGFDTLRLARAFDLADLVLPVFLLRDPRDVFRSIKRFNARRGRASFNDTGDDVQLLQVICQFEQRQVKEHARLGGMLMRYEALTAPGERDAALRTLLATLRLPATPALVESIWTALAEQRARVPHHITGDAGPPDDHAAVFATQAEALAGLGYAGRDTA